MNAWGAVKFMVLTVLQTTNGRLHPPALHWPFLLPAGRGTAPPGRLFWAPNPTRTLQGVQTGSGAEPLCCATLKETSVLDALALVAATIATVACLVMLYLAVLVVTLALRAHARRTPASLQDTDEPPGRSTDASQASSSGEPPCRE